jgi:ADP-heptose:LPS heptosyltransferase
MRVNVQARSMPISPNKEKKIAKYTRATRRVGRMDIVTDSAAVRFRKGVEGGVRRILYMLLRLFIRNEPLQSKIDIQDLDSLLVIPYGDAIGDMIAATPIWRAVKRRNPGCRVGVITSIRNESLITQDTDVDNQYLFNGRRDFGNISELRKARSDKYQVILNLHFTNQTDYGFISNYVGPNAIKVTADHPRREKYRLFFNHIGKRPRYSAHLSFFSLELLAEVVNFDPPLQLSEAWPAIVIPKEIESKIEAQVRAALPEHSTKYIVIHTQAGTEFREWGIDNSVELAKRLSQRFPKFAVFLTAAPIMHERLLKAIPPELARNVKFFRTAAGLQELAAFIERAALVVTPETSITHFASAVHTPAVVLMSNRDRIPIEWLPVATPARILAPSIGGQPVATIPIADVFEAAASLLTGAWTATQSSLDVNAEQSPMLQYENGHRLLSEFETTIITSSV